MVTNVMQLRTDGNHKVPFAKCIGHVTYHICIRCEVDLVARSRDLTNHVTDNVTCIRPVSAVL